MSNRFSDAYGGGSVVVNNLPYLQMRQNMLARQEAKQEAVDNYYRDLSKSLTPAGMAANDVEDFNGKVNAWRDYVTQNRDILSNPRNPDYGKVTNQAGYLYNDALSHSETSKQKVKDLFQGKTLIKPEHPLTDASVSALSQAGLPITKGYKPLDFSLLEYQPEAEKPAGAEDLIKYENFVKNGLQMSEGQPSIVVDPKTKSKVVTTKSFYQPDDINTMARRSEWLYQSDPKFHKMVNDMAADPNNYAQLNKSFKNVYGHDLDIKHPEEFATALLLGQTEKTNTQPYAYSPTNITINQGQIPPQQSVDNYINQLLQSANATQYKKEGGNWEQRLEIQPSPELSEMFAVKNGNKTYYPDHIQYNPNTKEWSSVFYKLNTDGSIAKGNDGKAAVDKDLSQTYSNDAIKVRIADKFLGQKDVKSMMANPPTNTEPKKTATSKSYKYNGKTYTAEQLTKAAQASGMSFDDYLKQLGLK